MRDRLRKALRFLITILVTVVLIEGLVLLLTYCTR